MIDLVKQFDKHSGKISDYLMGRMHGYYKSTTYLRLKSRMERLKDSNNMRYSTSRTNNFIGKFVVPLVKEISLNQRAVIKKAARNDPFLTYEPEGSTSVQNAVNMQETVGQNLRSTKFKATTFNAGAKIASQYGSNIV